MYNSHQSALVCKALTVCVPHAIDYHWEWGDVCAEESLIVSSTSTTLIGMSLQWDTVLRTEDTGGWYGAQYQSAVWHMGCYGYSDSYLQLLVATGFKKKSV